MLIPIFQFIPSPLTPWEKNLKKRGYMCMYNTVTLLYTWNKHNIVNQPYSNKNLKNKIINEREKKKNKQKYAIGHDVDLRLETRERKKKSRVGSWESQTAALRMSWAGCCEAPKQILPTPGILSGVEMARFLHLTVATLAGGSSGTTWLQWMLEVRVPKGNQLITFFTVGFPLKNLSSVLS